MTVSTDAEQRPPADRLAQIRERDRARGNSHAGITMTQSEADRRYLLKALDEMRERAEAAEDELEFLRPRATEH